MKVGIISDTHGSAGCWDMAYKNFFAGTDLILHAGDVLYHGPRNRLQDDYNPAPCWICRWLRRMYSFWPGRSASS